MSFDLSRPEINFAELARTLSVPARRVQTQDEIMPAIEAAFAEQGPFLIDVVIEGDVHPELIGLRCGL